MLACLLLLEGMKRFVFISRFSIAAGLTGAGYSGALFLWPSPHADVHVCLSVGICKWVHTYSMTLCVHCICACVCVTPSLEKPGIILSRTAWWRAAIRATLGEERRRGWEAMINDWGTLAEISGAVCKAVAFCLMWNKRTTATKVPASLHSRTAALRTYCIPSPPQKVCTCVCPSASVLVRARVCAFMVMRAYHEWRCFPLLSISCILSLSVFLCSARNDRQCPALCTPWKDTVSSSVQLQHICSIKRLKYRRLISLWMNRHLRERLSS